MAIAILAGGTRLRAQEPRNLYALSDWIRAHREVSSPEVEAELLPWPDWPPGCHDLTAYLSNIGTELGRRCGPEVRQALSEASSDCLGDGSLVDIARRLGDCAANLASVPSWVGRVSRCTVTSYVTATEMSEQDRSDWATFIDGLSDARALLGLANLFEAGKLVTLGDLRPPRSPGEVVKLTEQLEAVAAGEQERYQRLAKVPERFDSLRRAALTVPSLRRGQIASLLDGASDALERCDPEGAEDLWTMAKLEMVRHIGHLRANVAVAENAYHCAARKGRYDSWSIWQQDQFLGARDGGSPGDAILRRQWQHSNAEQRSALADYRSMRDDPRLAADRFREAQRRRDEKSEHLRRLTAVADACVATCGARRDGCTLPLATLAEALRSERGLACVQSGLAEEHELDRRLAALDRAELMANNVEVRVGRAVASIGGPLRRCDLPSARTELARLEREVGELGEGSAGAACGGGPLDALRRAVDDCETICRSPEITGCGRVGAAVKQVERGVGR